MLYVSTSVVCCCWFCEIESLHLASTTRIAIYKSIFILYWFCASACGASCMIWINSTICLLVHFIPFRVQIKNYNVNLITSSGGIWRLVAVVVGHAQSAITRNTVDVACFSNSGARTQWNMINDIYILDFCRTSEYAKWIWIAFDVPQILCVCVHLRLYNSKNKVIVRTERDYAAQWDASWMLARPRIIFRSFTGKLEYFLFLYELMWLFATEFPF